MDLMNKQKAVGSNPNRDRKCPTNKGRIACVNLTLQISWIQDAAGSSTGPSPSAPAVTGTRPAPA